MAEVGNPACVSMRPGEGHRQGCARLHVLSTAAVCTAAQSPPPLTFLLRCCRRMPTYYAQEFGLDVGHSAALSVLPWGLNVVCANVAGYYGDKVNTDRV